MAESQLEPQAGGIIIQFQVCIDFCNCMGRHCTPSPPPPPVVYPPLLFVTFYRYLIVYSPYSFTPSAGMPELEQKLAKLTPSRTKSESFKEIFSVYFGSGVKLYILKTDF